MRAKTRAERQAELMAQQLQTRAELRDATTGISDAIRGIESAAPEKCEPTATERIMALKALRQRMNGPIVQQPAPLTADAVRTWLARVAEIGSPGDLELAWHYLPDKTIKSKLEAEYKRLLTTSGQRYHKLQEAYKAEQQKARAERDAQARLHRLQQEAAATEARAVELRRQLVQAQD